MNNGNMPAMPLPDNVHRDLLESYCHGTIDPIGAGLTKREHFAAMAMQGFASKHGYHTWEDMAHDAVKCADALLKALEANNENN